MLTFPNGRGCIDVVAICGFNNAVIPALLAFQFTRFLGRWRAVVATMIGIAFYTLLVGSGPSVVRAAIMGSLSLLVIQLGRRQIGQNTLVSLTHSRDTNKNGWIELTTDGKQMWVKAERNR